MNETQAADEDERAAAADAERVRQHTHSLALRQVIHATADITLDPERTVRFGPESLHRIARYLGPRQLWVCVAGTGVGKTTMGMSMTHDMLAAGTRVAYLGLEMGPEDLRLALACLRAQVPRHVAVENSWREYRDGEQWLADVERELSKQLEPPDIDQLLFLPHRYVDTAVLLEAAEQAGQWGADILIVDHIHHVKHSAGGSDFGAFSATVQAAKRAADDLGLTMFCFAQSNREALRGGHGLSRYAPPKLHHIQGGGTIEQTADVVLGLYRPVIVPVNEDDRKRIKAAMAGEIEPTDVLQPWRMGVQILKHRANGSLEGKRCTLKLDFGHLTDPQEIA